MDTYHSHADSVRDHAHLQRLRRSLNAARNAVRLDACRMWTIRGRDGNYISSWGDDETWLLSIGCRSGLAWTWAKKRLWFCEVTQDGDDEGVLRLHRLPSKAGAEEIRALLGIRQHSPRPRNRVPDRSGSHR